MKLCPLYLTACHAVEPPDIHKARNSRVFETSPHSSANMDFSSTYAALRSLKRRTTTADELRILAEKLEKPFSREICLCI